MQNNTIAAAALENAAAAFNVINKNNSIAYCLSDDERRLIETTALHALRRITEKMPAVGNSLTECTRVLGFADLSAGLRVIRKAAAADIAGIADFWEYLNFWCAVNSYRDSLRRDLVQPFELKSGAFLKQYRNDAAQDLGGFFKVYSTEDYRLALGGSGGELRVMRKSDTFYCPIAAEWCSDAYSTRIFTRNIGLIAAAAPFNNGGHVLSHNCTAVMVSDFGLVSDYYEDYQYIDFYHASILGAEYADFQIFVFEGDFQHAHISEGYIWADGTFRRNPEGQVCTPSDAVTGYHQNTRLTNTPVRFSRNAPYLVGFEVEKEDLQVKCSITAADFYAALPNFRKERDGSLDCDKGFEFITPPLELSPRNIRAYLESRPVAVAHINAAYSTKCGGHIHLSRRGYSGRQLFEMIAGHLPLLHALFPARADGGNSHYCRAKSAAQLLRDREKYQSINIMNDRIEFRIFGAVRGIDNLEWRAGLLLKLFKHAANTPEIGYEKLPRLFSHLRKVYSTPAEMEMLIKRVEKYARKFEAYRPDFGADFATGVITDAARFKTYRPASARKLTTDAAGRTFVKTA
jgi:hypothetical protein